MTLTFRAEALARHLHADQTDKQGRPYVEHLEAVVGILLRRWPNAPEEAVAAAWLHDALEDTNLMADDLIHRGEMLPNVVNLVDKLTRHSAMTYRRWIKWLINHRDPWPIRIKLADLEHNMDPSRAIPGSDIVERRYAPARAVLERALEGRG